ncbi:MAG: response regulator [Candidatus Omnitrophica bacterium]|nr:response regulator [Candidatus Omnitrophota bacterium]
MRKKIIIIDDEPDVLRVLEIRLKKSGYEVFTGLNGQEALNLAHQIKPDLIILDVYLPLINGDEVAKILKNDLKLKHIAIILISATTQSLAQKTKESGADGFLVKPFESVELIEMIEKALK